MLKKIAHITDLHLDESFPFKDKTAARKRFDKVLESIIANGINHVICTGDIGENEGIPYFFDQLKKMDLSITLGNHDSFEKITPYYGSGADYDSEKIYKSEIEGHFKFIYLDSATGTVDTRQLEWLKEELKASTPIVIFMHHPIIGLDLKVDEIGKLKNRDALISILEAVPNSITVYCGHYHMESTLVHQNITQHITPAVAFQIEKDPSEIKIDTTTTGYRVLRLENGQLSSEVIILNCAD